MLLSAVAMQLYTDILKSLLIALNLDINYVQEDSRKSEMEN